jgi:hypothetical protein
MNTMKIEIYSDLTCPWCYIGKHRMQAGLKLLGRAHKCPRHFSKFFSKPWEKVRRNVVLNPVMSCRLKSSLHGQNGCWGATGQKITVRRSVLWTASESSGVKGKLPRAQREVVVMQLRDHPLFSSSGPSAPSASKSQEQQNYCQSASDADNVTRFYHYRHSSIPF